MIINDSWEASGLFELGGVDSVDASRKYKSVQESTTPSGDTVRISDEARKLFSEMIHKYDRAGQSGESAPADSKSQTTAPAAEAKEDSEGAAQGGGGGSTSSGEDVESIKQKIQALKSQISSLASQMGSGMDQAAMSKINALQAEIGALEAQLNEMATA